MTSIALPDASTSLLAPGTLTFADLLARLESDDDLDAVRKRDMASGLRGVAKALGRPREAVPADPGWLQPRLGRVAPASLNLSAKSWSNTVSNARAAMAHFGCVRRRHHRKTDLSPAWRVLWEAVLASGDKTLRPALGRFVYFFDDGGVAPEAVTDVHAAAYHQALIADEIRKSPDKVFKNALHAWNMAARLIDGWPQQRLTVPTTAKRIKLPLGSFPSGFRDDLERFRTRLLHPDLLDPDALDAPRSQSTVEQYSRELVRFASILVHAGTPIVEIDSLAAVVDPIRAELGLRWMLDRNEGRTARGISQTATLLKLVAKRHVRSPEAEQKALDRMAARLALKKQVGMTTKNRDRLRALQNPDVLRRLLLLPYRLFDRAEAGGDTRAGVLEREDAVAIAILLVTPIRRHNLATIHLERNLHRPGDGAVFLAFTPEEVKNRQAIAANLPPDVVSMIDRLLATRSPRLCPAATPWLFPRRDGSGPMHDDGLSKRIWTRIRKEIGLDVNPHLFRHLSAKLLLDANPGGYETVRQVLGHARLSTTMNVYTGLEADTATRLFADVVEAARRR